MPVFPNPWVLLGGIIAIIFLVVTVGAWQNHAGHVAERDTWQQKENKELTEANAKIIELTSQYRALETADAAALSEVSTQYERKLKNASDQNTRDIAAIRNGSLVFNDPGQRHTRGTSVPETAAGTSGRNGAEGTGLSGEAAEFLSGQANAADAVVGQLTACQEVIAKEQKLFGGFEQVALPVTPAAE